MKSELRSPQQSQKITQVNFNLGLSA